jgi:hypothetical protein
MLFNKQISKAIDVNLVSMVLRRVDAAHSNRRSSTKTFFWAILLTKSTLMDLKLWPAAAFHLFQKCQHAKCIHKLTGKYIGNFKKSLGVKSATTSIFISDI